MSPEEGAGCPGAGVANGWDSHAPLSSFICLHIAVMHLLELSLSLSLLLPFSLPFSLSHSVSF